MGKTLQESNNYYTGSPFILYKLPLDWYNLFQNMVVSTEQNTTHIIPLVINSTMKKVYFGDILRCSSQKRYSVVFKPVTVSKFFCSN